MPRVTIPLYTDLEYKYQSSQTIEDLNAQCYMKNCFVSKIGEKYTVEKRPGFLLYAGSSSSWEGYGVFYWGNDYAPVPIYVIYDGSNMTLRWGPSATNIGTLFATYHGEDGTHVSWAAIDSAGSEELAVHVHQRSISAQGIYTVDDHLTTITQITTATHGYPDVTAGDYTVPGMVYLDGYIFVACINGKVFNSNLDDIYTWTATDFISAERELDWTRFICKHLNNVVVFGDQSIEFFYNAGNPGGSPLSRREDVFYNIGVAASTGVLSGRPPIDSDDTIIAFVGNHGYVDNSKKQADGVYVIENFQLRKISTPSIDKLVNGLASINIMDLQDRKVIVVTQRDSIYNNQYYNYVYDMSSGLWSIWEFFNVDSGKSMNGSYSDWFITFNNAQVFSNNGHNDLYRFNDGNATLGYTPFEAEVVTQDWDGGSVATKYLFDTTLVGQFSDSGSADNVSISWSDDGGNTFNTARTVDQRYMRPLSRCGTARRRRWKVTHSSDDAIGWEALDIRVGPIETAKAGDT